MVDVWQLGAAVAILRQIEVPPPPSIWSHSAYGLLSIVFTYFEMLGKSLRASGKSGEDFNMGFCDVYPTFTPATQYCRLVATVPHTSYFTDSLGQQESELSPLR